METFLARLTWNQDQWKRPSGALGKREQGTYVARQGFGQEEWLNRREWEINGWRYGFVQGVSRSRERLEGERANLRFYAITPVGERVYVGEVRNAEILTPAQATTAVKVFARRGWLETMKREVDRAGGQRRMLHRLNSKPTELANIRFRPIDLHMFAEPVAAKPRDRVWRLDRYQLYRMGEADTREWQDRTRRAPLEREKGEDPLIRKAVKQTIVRQIENRMQREVCDLLRKRFGPHTVVREKDHADIRVTTEPPLLIEVKADRLARRAIRDALGQLLFYGYRDGNNRPEPRLVVIGQGALAPADVRWLRALQSRFDLSIQYLRYQLSSGVLNF